MKRFFKTILPIAALLSAGNTAIAENFLTNTNEGGERVITISIDEFKATSKETPYGSFVTLSLPGLEQYAGVDYELGHPQIPVLRFEIPAQKSSQISTFGSANPASSGLNIQYENGISAQTTQLIQRVFPNQEFVPKLPGAERTFTLSEAAYSAPTRKPFYSLSEPYSIRGEKFQLLTIRPLSYDPTSNQVTRIPAFEIRLNEQAVKPLSDTPDTFAVVVGSKFAASSALETYKAHKESMGFSVETIVINNAKRTPLGVRKALQALYKSTGGSLKYAILVGDIDQIPAYEGLEGAKITDHYYQAIDTNDYASDINGPDIAVGRISIQDEETLERVLTRYMRYETAARADSTGALNKWLDKATFIATDDGNYWQLAEASHNYVIDKYTSQAGYNGDFPESPQMGGGKIYAITHQGSGENINAALRAGRSLINYSGHGMPFKWDAPFLDQAAIRANLNPDAMPYVIANACLTAKFSEDESIGETWQRTPNGAIAYWGGVSYTFWEPDDILEKNFYDAIFRLKKTRFGDMMHHGIKKHWEHFGGAGFSRYYWEVYELFGDPSIHFQASPIVGK